MKHSASHESVMHGKKKMKHRQMAELVDEVIRRADNGGRAVPKGKPKKKGDMSRMNGRGMGGGMGGMMGMME